MTFPETFLMLGDPPQMLPEPVRVPLKRCCGLLDGDECDCAELAAQMQAAPVVHIGTGWYR